MTAVRPTDFRALIETLADANVELIVIGGIAATLHGSARATLDLDVVYQRTPANIRRLVQALTPLSPYLRGAPPGLPFAFDEATVADPTKRCFPPPRRSFSSIVRVER